MLHLVKRFFGSLATHPLDDRERSWVKEVLAVDEFELWNIQAITDQRHSFDIAKRFIDLRPQASRDEIAGALLHDIGKVGANMGTILRVIATLIPLPTRRFKAYRHHEQNGALLLHAVGSSESTVALVAGHPDSEALRALRCADNV